MIYECTYIHKYVCVNVYKQLDNSLIIFISHLSNLFSLTVKYFNLFNKKKCKPNVTMHLTLVTAQFLPYIKYLFVILSLIIVIKPLKRTPYPFYRE